MMCKATAADNVDFPAQVRQDRWLLTWTWTPPEVKAGEMMPNCSWMKVIFSKPIEIGLMSANVYFYFV